MLVRRPLRLGVDRRGSTFFYALRSSAWIAIAAAGPGMSLSGRAVPIQRAPPPRPPPPPAQRLGHVHRWRRTAPRARTRRALTALGRPSTLPHRRRRGGRSFRRRVERMAGGWADGARRRTAADQRQFTESRSERRRRTGRWRARNRTARGWRVWCGSRAHWILSYESTKPRKPNPRGCSAVGVGLKADLPRRRSYDTGRSTSPSSAARASPR